MLVSVTVEATAAQWALFEVDRSLGFRNLRESSSVDPATRARSCKLVVLLVYVVSSYLVRLEAIFISLTVLIIKDINEIQRRILSKIILSLYHVIK